MMFSKFTMTASKNLAKSKTRRITNSEQPSKRNASTVKWLFLTSLLISQSYAHADNIDSPYLKGGKLDAYYERQDNGDFRVNSMIWTPVFKGGQGSIISEMGGRDLNYFGGFVSPLVGHPEYGTLILGAQEILQGDGKQTEVQGEYRLPFGLGFGGGFVDRNQSAQDVKFAKVSYRNQWEELKYIVSLQWQNFQDKESPGGYIALYNKEFMVTWGNDGEQWRSTFGYVSPDKGGDKLRPAFEAFYVDNSIGDVNGSKDLWLTGSLGFRKGFLGHESRLGRAMGPTGLEMSNPIAFLNPLFNRRLTAWEVGDLVNFRYIHSTAANGVRTEMLDTAIYPGQFLGTDNLLLNSFFTGVGLNNPSVGTEGVTGLFGYHGRIDHFESSFRVQYDFGINETATFFDIIYWL